MRFFRHRALLFLLCVAPAVAARQGGKTDDGTPPYFNAKMRQMLIEGSYKILPATPIEVGRERQLLMDRFIVDDAWGCRRTVHQPDKYEKNPLLSSENAAEQSMADGGIVRFDALRGTFTLWSRQWFKARKKYRHNIVQVLYESPDGVRWTAPALGLYASDGVPPNAINAADGTIYGAPSVVEVPARLASRGKYAMLYGGALEKPAPGQHHGMFTRIAWSSDGIRWRDQPENPVIQGRTDTFNNMVYNPERDVFMMYRRPSVNANQIRRIAYSESKDLVAWTQPEVIVLPDEIDPSMVYGMPVTRYQGVYLGFLQMFYTGEDAADPVMAAKDLKIDIQLLWSRDGIRWERHPARPIFLPTGSPEGYDWGMVFVMQGLPERDGKVHVYYNADNAFHIGAQVAKGRTGQLCLATLRRDGFVSLDAPKEGYMLTRPLRAAGSKLHVNARVAPGGFVKIAVRRGDGVRDGDWIEGWNFAEGPVYRGDSIDAVLEWKGRSDFAALGGQAIRLHFWMKSAELYSFWFE
jgi:hypothetical protein